MSQQRTQVFPRRKLGRSSTQRKIEEIPFPDILACAPAEWIDAFLSSPCPDLILVYYAAWCCGRFPPPVCVQLAEPCLPLEWPLWEEDTTCELSQEQELSPFTWPIQVDWSMLDTSSSEFQSQYLGPWALTLSEDPDAQFVARFESLC